MSDRQEPNWDAIANQRLYAYLDSCEGCEDCDCEDVEHPEHATCMCKLLTGETKDDCDTCEQVCECKCHNIPHDPRDDRPEPDDIPDWYPEGD